MGWGPVQSSQNRSYELISEKSVLTLHIYDWGYNVKILHGRELFVYKKIVDNNLFSHSVLKKFVVIGWGPLNSSQNRSCELICEKNSISLHISNMRFHVKILHASEFFVYKK